ncbi:hypothetical protein HDU93_009286 [Gonapodya sp. JEL0774]|nr:hypothetical protein HDU93_009286 [Gonapodya sp. JEL0774]
MSNSGRVAIVTGSSSGIGKAVAIQLAAAGWNVVINCSSSVAAANAAADEINAKQQGKAIVVQADVGKDEECKKLVDKTVEAFGRLDAVVNNAGTTKFNAHNNLPGLTSEDFLRIYSVNVVAPYNMVKYAEPHLRRSGKASVVNVSSIAGIMGAGSCAAYGPEIRVNAVCPGFVEGDWLRNGYGDKVYEAMKNNYAKSTPLHASVTAEDIAECVVFLCSSGNKVTGEILKVDSGFNLSAVAPPIRL